MENNNALNEDRNNRKNELKNAMGHAVVIRDPFIFWMYAMTNIDFTIDYLQYTSIEMPRYKPLDNVERWQKSYMKMYQKMMICENGTHLHVGNPNSDRTLVLMSGNACKKIGVDNHFLANILDKECNVTRLDLAMTTDKNILPYIMDSHEQIESALWQGVKVIADAQYTPQTIYIGDMSKRGKKGIVRAYDKGLQLGLDIEMYRIETELRKKHSKISAKRLATGDTIPSVMNSKFYIDATWYADFLGTSVSTSRFRDIEKQDDDRPIDKKMSWLMKSVVPSLQYVLDYDKANGTHNFEAIINSLEFE